MREGQPVLSIVIPVFRSEGTLTSLFSRIDEVARRIDPGYELILVEDCGGDESWSRMKALREAHPRHVRIVQLTRNFGQHNALLCGFSFVRGRYVITMDDDLQNPPEEIPKLVASMDASDADVVYGVAEKKKHSILKNLGSLMYLRMISYLFQLKSGIKLSNFRIARRPVIDEILKFSTPNPSIGLMLLAVTHRIGSIPVAHHPRKAGRSHYSLSKMMRLFLHGLLYHSDLPLRAVFAMGIGCLLLSMTLGAYYLFLYFSGAIGVSGWTTLVLLLLFFAGIGMFSVGVIGEYLLRILQEVNKVPQYIIREKEVETR
jgi:dolichol-phosphate mannosyltransferase/undecaprenyl-phosphate 4-deoxy-4-formamido-L-arabinose transferase